MPGSGGGPYAVALAAARWSSEIPLNADLQQECVLIPELIHRRRLWRRRRQGRSACEFLVEMKPLRFGRERQALDRCPANIGAELRHVVVRIADIVRTDRL